MILQQQVGDNFFLLFNTLQHRTPAQGMRGGQGGVANRVSGRGGIDYNSLDIINRQQMNSKSDGQLTFKILLIGSSGVGKSSLLLKYIKNTFSYDYQVTTGVEFYTKQVKINEKTTIKMQIWDTVGQESFRAVVRSFYKGVSAVLLVYSIDRYESFEQLSSWMKEIQENAHKQTMVWVIGAKLDLQDIRKVPKVKVQQYAKSIDAVGTMEVSAKTGQNVKQLFEKLAKTLYKKFNSSDSFKELVQPMLADESPMKTQSFSLSNQRGRNTNNGNKNCCA